MGVASRIRMAARAVFSREELPEESPCGPGRATSGQTFLSFLFRPESLAEDPEPPGPRKAYFFSWLLSREELPEDPVEAEGKKGFWGTLFQFESLPAEQGDTKGE